MEDSSSCLHARLGMILTPWYATLRSKKGHEHHVAYLHLGVMKLQKYRRPIPKISKQVQKYPNNKSKISELRDIPLLAAILQSTSVRNATLKTKTRSKNIHQLKQSESIRTHQSQLYVPRIDQNQSLRVVTISTRAFRNS